ncbi:MAG TPA: hypothetical protein VD704_08545 [Gaiellaceae bacterium]|nr:hypothetical protein [Gaiellaceae bacterium]
MPYALPPEEEAEGLVLSVFRDVRERMPFVPAVFRALAADPVALEQAWLQARALHDDPRATTAASRLAGLARPELRYRPSAAVRAAAAPFAAELPLLLLVVTSLGLSLDGALAPVALPPARLPEPEPLPATDVPELRSEHPLFAEVRAVYGTEHVPSMMRALAAQGLLEEPWAAIGRFLGGPKGKALVARLESAAESEARAFPEYAFFTSESARPVLAQFRVALPRNLVFATAATA